MKTRTFLILLTLLLLVGGAGVFLILSNPVPAPQPVERVLPSDRFPR